VLLEREPLLASLSSYLDEAMAGTGRAVFLGGEAGAGKTALVNHFGDSVGERLRVLRGACDGTSTPRPLGPLVDIATVLGASVEEQLGSDQPLRGTLFPAVRAALTSQPTLFLVEDAHWADEATLDMIRFLARRLADTRVLYVITFRDDEVPADHPLTIVMGDLASTAGLARMQVPLLTPAAVAELTAAAGKYTDAAELYRRTGGNPFFVTEAVSTDSDGIPPSVRDAVLARAARLPPPSRAVLAAAAVIGLHCDVPLLLTVSGQSAGALDECIHNGVLLSAGVEVSFRHELARQVIEESLPAATRVRLHSLVLDSLTQTGVVDHRRLAYHAEESARSAAVAAHAPLAARRAARLGAHREAATHYRAALRHGARLPDSVRADLLEALSYECYLTDQLSEALDARTMALDLRRDDGDPRLIGADLRWLSRLSWFNGNNRDADRYGKEAVAFLEPLGVGPELAMAYSNMAQLRMLVDDTDGAVSWGGRAMELANRIGDQDVMIHALINVGTARLRGDDLSEGVALLHNSLNRALAVEAEEHAARAFNNLGVGYLEQWLLRAAERNLREGIAYCADRDLDPWRLSMEAELARALVHRGRYVEGQTVARRVLRHPRLSHTARVPALTVVGLVSVRRGESPAAALLAEARAAGEPTGELQDLVPVAAALAELAWTAGRPETIVEETKRAWAAALETGDPWALGELGWWRHVGGAQPPASTAMSEPFALMIGGETTAAAAQWATIGAPHWQALALAWSHEVPGTKQALAILDSLGAAATARAVMRHLRLRGLPVPRGPRPATRDNPAGLTAREFEVLRLLADGLSNAELARQLTLSEKTVVHHVSAVLRKLDAPSRSKAVAIAAKLGMLSNERSPS
jgi:DNA-binding CsgD family transcriptional regulator/tetratricopeptide (TPR) repeat protein